MEKTILVVDDSPSVRQQVSMALRQAGFVVKEACDGAEGLAAIERESSIAAVVCDVNMPRMNGLEMVEAVSRNAQISAVPILMLTSEVQASMLDRAKKAGAKGWIVKPFKAELLVSAVRKLAGVDAA